MDSRLERALTVGLVALVAGCASVEEPSPGYRPISATEGRALVGRLLPDGVKDRAGWATDIYAAFAALDIPPTAENICAAVAVTGQESGFQVDPVVPGLAGIARKEIDKRRESAGIPEVRPRRRAGASLDQRQELQRAARRREDELQLSEIYEDFIGRVPFGKSLLADRNPVRTGGPMQVSIAFAEAFAAAKPYPYPVAGTIRHEVFTRRGGVYFGIAHLLDYPAPYTRPLYRFADFNAGQYASRNAAFQSAVTQVSGIPLELDGDLLRYDRGQPAARARQHRARDARAGASDRPEQRGHSPRSRSREERRASSRPGSTPACSSSPTSWPGSRRRAPCCRRSRCTARRSRATSPPTGSPIASKVATRRACSAFPPEARPRYAQDSRSRPRRYRSAMLERRLALFHERAHPFLLVVEAERAVKFAALEQETLGE